VSPGDHEHLRTIGLLPFAAAGGKSVFSGALTGATAAMTGCATAIYLSIVLDGSRTLITPIADRNLPRITKVDIASQAILLVRDTADSHIAYRARLHRHGMNLNQMYTSLPHHCCSGIYLVGLVLGCGAVGHTSSVPGFVGS
jgi:hypothetical protein